MRKMNKGLACLMVVCLCIVSVSFQTFAQEPDTMQTQTSGAVPEDRDTQGAGDAAADDGNDQTTGDITSDNGNDQTTGGITSDDGDDRTTGDTASDDENNRKAGNAALENDKNQASEDENDNSEPDSETPLNDDPGAGRLQGDIPEEFFGMASFGLRSSGIQHDSKFDGYTIEDGIDVSEWNKTINWTKVKQAGIDFAIIRVAYRGWGDAGTLAVDNKAVENLKGAIAAGIPVGVYIFSQATTEKEAIEEANYITDKIRGYNISLPVVMDFEFASAGGLVGRLYNKFGTSNATNKNAATKVCMAFCKQVASKGYTPMVYANADMLRNHLNASTISASYPVWLANYTTKTDYTGDYSYWQYSSTGKVSGISGNVDMNVRYMKDIGGAGGTTPEVTVTTPELVSAANSNGGVTVTWKQVSDAKGYRIYRKEPGGSWTRTGTVSSNKTVTYKDSTAVSGKEYIYTVRGYNGSVLSGYDKTGVSTLYLAAPALKSAQGSSSAVKVTWGKVDGAEGYYVYRKVSGGKWGLIATIKNGNTVTYSDKTGEKGTTYYYTVRAYKGSTRSYYVTPGVSAVKASYMDYKTTASVYYRSGPGTSYAKKGLLASGKTISVEVGYSKKANGYTWYRFKTGTATYYIASKYLKKATAAKPKITYTTYTTTAKVNYRSGAGTVYAVKGTLAKGKTISVENGYSKKANGYTWYRFKSGTKTYYIATKYIKKGTAAASAKKTYTSYKTTAKVNYRSGAGTVYAVKGTLAKGKTISVENGYSKKANGYTWYRFKSGTKTYYIASKYIKKAGPSYIKYKTTDTVNYRSGAGTSYAVKGALAKGKTISVEKGYSRKANGYTWYRFKSGTKTYYVASKYLKKA